ncbi:MAG: transglycosylase family protein [Acidimicrobiales bacterium]
MQAPPAGGVWAALRQCESGGNYSANTGNGYYGAYQFTLSTWYSLGQAGLPSQAPPATQDSAAELLQSRAGWGQWPACSQQLGI